MKQQIKIVNEPAEPLTGGTPSQFIKEADYSYINKNADLSWLLSRYEISSERYMEAENFILEIAEMKWYQRIFCLPKIIRFLNSRSKYESNNLKLK